MRALIVATLVVAVASALRAQDHESPSVVGARKLAVYAPRPIIPAEARVKHLKGAGVCIVYVRPDGSVSRAVMSPSTGQPLLDKASIDAFSRWKFVPHALTKVKIPVRYTGDYPKPQT
jgi:TonB family protein